MRNRKIIVWIINHILLSPCCTDEDILTGQYHNIYTGLSVIIRYVLYTRCASWQSRQEQNSQCVILYPFMTRLCCVLYWHLCKNPHLKLGQKDLAILYTSIIVSDNTILFYMRLLLWRARIFRYICNCFFLFLRVCFPKQEGNRYKPSNIL